MHTVNLDGVASTEHVFAAGTAKDVSLLIDFLPSYLFPNGERTVSDWGIAGISLGGHSSWIGLAHGTAVTIIDQIARHTDGEYRSQDQIWSCHHRVPRFREIVPISHRKV